MIIMPQLMNTITIFSNFISLIFECLRLELLNVLPLPCYVEYYFARKHKKTKISDF